MQLHFDSMFISRLDVRNRVRVIPQVHDYCGSCPQIITSLFNMLKMLRGVKNLLILLENRKFELPLDVIKKLLKIFDDQNSQ